MGHFIFNNNHIITTSCCNELYFRVHFILITPSWQLSQFNGIRFCQCFMYNAYELIIIWQSIKGHSLIDSEERRHTTIMCK